MSTTPSFKFRQVENPMVEGGVEWQLSIFLPDGRDVHARGPTVHETLMHMAAYLRRNGIDL